MIGQSHDTRVGAFGLVGKYGSVVFASPTRALLLSNWVALRLTSIGYTPAASVSPSWLALHFAVYGTALPGCRSCLRLTASQVALVSAAGGGFAVSCARLVSGCPVCNRTHGAVIVCLVVLVRLPETVMVEFGLIT